eukprot:3804503-Rhodomonas_salina.1
MNSLVTHGLWCFVTWTASDKQSEILCTAGTRVGSWLCMPAVSAQGARHKAMSAGGGRVVAVVARRRARGCERRMKDRPPPHSPTGTACGIHTCGGWRDGSRAPRHQCPGAADVRDIAESLGDFGQQRASPGVMVSVKSSTRTHNLCPLFFCSGAEKEPDARCSELFLQAGE